MKQKFYWTEESLKVLKEFWNIKSLYKLAEELHTIPETVKEKAIELGLGEYKSNRWTKEEEELLKEYSKKYVTKTIAKKLNRSYLAVQKKAIKMGLELHSTVDPWKKWMVDYLKDNINKIPIGKIEEMLGLSYHVILTKCKELGIEYRKESWTEEEIKILREYASKCHYTELTKVLPNRTIGAISAKAYELGIQTISSYTKLSEEQIEYIKDKWGKIPSTEIARNLRISIGILNRYKKELSLPNVGQQKKWTGTVVAKLREDSIFKTRNELAKKYKTSPEQISKIARENNIKLIDSKIIWTEELNKKLDKLILQGKGINEISKELNMSASSVRQQIRKIKGESFVNNDSKVIRWTDEEVNLLKKLFEEYSILEISKLLNKTERQVKNKISKLGLVKNENNRNLWNDEDTRQLLDLYKNYNLYEISKKMGRAEVTIRDKAKQLGIDLNYNVRTQWSPEEELLLMEYAKQYSIKEISSMMGRTTSSISSKLAYMGIKAVQSSKFWTNEEEEQLKLLTSTNSIEEISQIMDKSYGSVITKLNKLGLKAKNHTNRRWSAKEEQELLELLTSFSSFEVAEILDRSEEAVSVRAKKLGYHIDYKHRRWTTEDEVLLQDLWGSVSIDIIAGKLNRTVSSIINRVYKLGLGSQIENNYEGLTIQNIEEIFKVNRNTILTSWVSLGLKLSFKRRSVYNVYSFVLIKDLYEFLEKNQNIWDSRVLEKNILGTEPEWLKEKRVRDINFSLDYFGIKSLSKQQLLLAKQYYLELNQTKDTNEEATNLGPKLKKVIEKEDKK